MRYVSGLPFSAEQMAEYPYLVMMPDFTPEDDDDETCGKCFEGECCHGSNEEDEEWDNYD